MFNIEKPTLYLIRGVSGSGKTTLASEMIYFGMVDCVVEADNFFLGVDGKYNFDKNKLGDAHLRCQQMTELALKHKGSVAVSNTSTTEKEVKTYKELAEKYNANFVSLIVENRNNTKNIHDVSEDVLTKQRNRFSIKL